MNIISGVAWPPYCTLVIKYKDGRLEQLAPPNTKHPRQLISWMPGAKIVNHAGEEVASLISDHIKEENAA